LPGKIEDSPLPNGSEEIYSYTFNPEDPTPILGGKGGRGEGRTNDL
jgi:hypothetical protein